MKNNPIENLLFLFLITHPVSNPKRIYNSWYKHPTLKEYRRPEIKTVTATVESLKIEIRQMGFYF